LISGSSDLNRVGILLIIASMVASFREAIALFLKLFHISLVIVSYLKILFADIAYIS
jgi:hypothetical protein